MDYLKKIHSSVAAQVHQVAAQVNLALPGNPIFREYAVGAQIASAGPGLCWKIYSGTKNSTKQEVAIWLFEKKQTENWLKVKRDELPEMLKKGVSQLTRLRHPRILTVERSLEESRDCFAFCTEPIFASLANCFGDLDNILNPPRQLKGLELQDVEIRHGLFQITEALAFLHNDTKMIHGNISPNSIIINSKGAWKLGGFDFCIVGNISPNGKATFNVPNWSQNSISALCPGLDYVSPELTEGAKCDPFSDIFSLGVLAFATFNKGKPLFDSQNSFACYRKNFDQLKNSLSTLLLIVPEEIREDIKMCLNQTPELRPDAIQFTKLPFFEHPLVKTLNFLETRNAMENTQKMQFFKGLAAILPQFPQRVQIQKIYPHLAAEYSTPVLVPFILQSVFLIADNASADEFANTIMPTLVTVFPIQTPYQIGLLLLQRVNLFLDKMPAPAIKQHLLPLIYNSLSSESIKIQELCLSEVPNVVKFVDRDQMRSQLLPKLLRMVLESREVNIRVQSMVCLAKLLDNLEGWMVSDQLLPALPKVNSKNPAVLMAVLGIYKMVFEHQKFGIPKDQCAKSVLPFLIATCVESTLNLGQFNQFIQLVHQLLEKVETEQRQTLQQLSASQEQQRKITDFADFLNTQTAATNGTGEVDLGDLAFMIGGGGNGGSPTNKSTASSTTDSANKIGLSLEEKKKMAAEKEQQQQFGGGQRQQQSRSESAEEPKAQSPSSFDPFPSLTLASTSSQKRPMSAQQHSSTTSGTNLDLLAEFMPPSSSSTTQISSSPFMPTALQPSTNHHHSQQQKKESASSFTANFPSIPLPTASSNPIQRRMNNNQLIDPFDSILGSTTTTKSENQEKRAATADDQITANFFSQLNKGGGGEGNSSSTGGRDPFRDLLS